jgi:hypothetical protein
MDQAIDGAARKITKIVGGGGEGIDPDNRFVSKRGGSADN